MKTIKALLYGTTYLILTLTSPLSLADATPLSPVKLTPGTGWLGG